MLIEAEVEQKIAAEILAVLPDAEVTCSRRVAAAGGVKRDDSLTAPVTVIVKGGVRQFDSFSLTTVNIPFTVTVVTRCDLSPTGSDHEYAVEKLVGLFDGWHRDGETMTQKLSTVRLFAAELRMDGGNGEVYDDELAAWTDTISFTVRGDVSAPVIDND